MTTEFDAGAEKQSERVYSNEAQLKRGLLSRNVRIHKHRTSVRLEAEMWLALNEIAEAEGCSVHDLCGAVHDLKEEGASFTAALRVFLMEYYRSVARTSARVSNVQKKLRDNGIAAERGATREA